MILSDNRNFRRRSRIAQEQIKEEQRSIAENEEIEGIKTIQSQSHVHEFIGVTKLSGQNTHNHRFSGVTSQLIPISEDNHKHTILVNTDYYDHLHEIAIETGQAIFVGKGKHIHFISGNTTVDDEHLHEYVFTTLIEAPLLPQKKDI